MTAEIAVMNRIAVALAADSAVTIGTGDSTKIFQTENKLFELSEASPIGLMIYNSTHFFGVPWEIIIKSFRKEISVQKVAKIEQWVPIFCDFVMDRFGPTKEQQEQHVLRLLVTAFRSVDERFSHFMSHFMFSDEESDELAPGQVDAKVRDGFSNSVQDEIDQFTMWSDLDSISTKAAQEILSKYRSVYDQAFEDFFGHYPLQRPEKLKIRQLAVWVIRSSRPGDFTTGLVFAGFGEKEIFPSLKCIEVHGVIDGKLKFIDLEMVDIDRKDTPGAIIPFAQREAAESFLYGRTDEYEMHVVDHFRGVVEEISFGLIDEAFDDEALNAEYRERAASAADAAMRRFVSKTSWDIKRRLFSEILSITNHMPKQELASFAEALVNVTSIKRKMSVGPETVGGPIDVAIISKHEGFIWVKRKHYFNSNLNPRYMARAYSRMGADSHEAIE